MEIEFQLTEKDYERFYWLFFKGKVKKNAIGLIVVPLLIGYLIAGQPFDWVKFIYGLVISEFIYGGCFLFIPYFFKNRKQKRSLSSNPQYFEPVKLWSTEDGLYRVKKDETLKWEWKNITAIRSNTEFLWLILDNKKYYLIPQRAFSSYNEMQYFIGAIQDSINKYHRINQSPKKIVQPIHNSPPYILGIICLIPLIGAFAGVLFIILGVSKYKDKWFTLIGVFGIVFTISVYSWLTYMDSHSLTVKNGFISIDEMELNNLVINIEYYKVQHGEYPDSLQQLTDGNNTILIYDPIQGRNNRTNTPFFYKRDSTKYELFSCGEDGKPHTKDDIFPQVTKSQVKNIGLTTYQIKGDDSTPDKLTTKDSKVN